METLHSIAEKLRAVAGPEVDMLTDDFLRDTAAHGRLSSIEADPEEYEEYADVRGL